MNSILNKIAPLIFGLTCIIAIRLVTDIAFGNLFWERSLSINIKDIVIPIIGVYILTSLYPFILKKNEDKRSPVKEYLIITAYTFAGVNLTVFVTHYFIDYPNELIDFVIANVVIIPLALFYYTMIRNNAIQQRLSKKSLLLEQTHNRQLETELKFLKGQFHPHFLFNALNTVYFQIHEDNEEAKHTVKLLSHLLRYQLYSVDKKVSMSQEIDYLKTYIEFQKIRTSERLQLNTSFDPGLNSQEIHPLLFQPLVENAFKYIGGEYCMNVEMSLQNNNVWFQIENSTSEMRPLKRKEKGVGLDNLKRRLELLYPDKHTMEIDVSENTFLVTLFVEIDNGN